jgi:hypothetical protein
MPKQLIVFTDGIVVCHSNDNRKGYVHFIFYNLIFYNA